MENGIRGHLHMRQKSLAWWSAQGAQSNDKTVNTYLRRGSKAGVHSTECGSVRVHMGAVLLCIALTACGHPASAPRSPAPTSPDAVNVYNWFDYLNPQVLRTFEARYGIPVHYSVFDSNNTLESKLLAGHSGYDVVFPSGAYLESLNTAGVFRRLDPAQLPNLKNLDPDIMGRLAAHDPGNAHAVVYTWGITGIAYDEAAVRPYIRKISSGSLVDDLATGELCVIIASNGDAMQAQERTRIAGNGKTLRYVIPREGAVMWFDVAAIPADAPHAANAHKLINFLMDPAIAAENSNAIRFPNGNAAAQPAMQPELANAAIFPKGELASRLIPERAKSETYVRLRTRLWTRFRTGK
jgi:putrescine transport system substrate-binding protein